MANKAKKIVGEGTDPNNIAGSYDVKNEQSETIGTIDISKGGYYDVYDKDGKKIGEGKLEDNQTLDDIVKNYFP